MYVILIIGLSIIIFSQIGLKTRPIDKTKSDYFDFSNKVNAFIHISCYALITYNLINGSFQVSSLQSSLLIALVIGVMCSFGHIISYFLDRYTNPDNEFSKRWNIELTAFCTIGFLAFMSFLDIWLQTEDSLKVNGINSIFLIVVLIVVNFLFFSKRSNKTIWEWVNKNIWNMFSNNNSLATSERNEAIGYLKQGNNEYKNGRFNEAIKYYTKAIEIDSNFKEAHNNRTLAKKALVNYSGFSKDNKKSKSSFGFLSNYLSDENLIYKLSGFSFLIIAAIGTLRYGFDLGFYEHIFWVFIAGAAVAVSLIVPVYIISLLSPTDKYSMTFMSIVYAGLIFGILALWGVVALSIYNGEDFYTPKTYNSIKIDPSRL